MSLYYTPAGFSTISLLADHILAVTATNPLAMAKGLVLLPNRRSCRFLQATLLEKSPGNNAIILPRIQPIGDIQPDLPIPGLLPQFLKQHAWNPAIDHLRRRFLLARLIEQAGFMGNNHGNFRQALRLAQSLEELLAETIAFGLDWQSLDQIVTADFAEHWQKTLKFLNILYQVWPKILLNEGAVDPETLHQQALEVMADYWLQENPAIPVFMAGLPRPTAAVLKLLSVIANLPNGLVLLPSFQPRQSTLLQQEIRQEPTHPYYHLMKILDFLKQDPLQVKPWPGIESPASATDRQQLLELAMRPASLISDWDHQSQFSPANPTPAANIRLIECPAIRQESQVIALIIRDSLEKPGQRIALITPDRQLTLRVRLELKRWGITIDDSAGQPLHQTDVGKYLRLTALMFQPDGRSSTFLAALKHPFSRGGRRRSFFLRLTRDLEKRLLRQGLGPKIDALIQACTQVRNGKRLIPFLQKLAQKSEKFSRLFQETKISLSTLVEAHCRFAEWLASEKDQPVADLWAGEAGEAAAQMMADLMQSGLAGIFISPRHYADILTDLLQEKVIYPQLNFNPRLYLWGRLEAQLQHVDVVILAGLNEGEWPSNIQHSPWLNNHLRQRLGLPAAQELVGEMAFDFVQNCQANQVFLTRSIKVDGTPTRPSRFLQRLQALAQVKFADDLGETHWLQWQQQLTPITSSTTQRNPPLPTPTIHQRPTRLSATDIQLLLRNPYEFYCRHILKLKPLPALDQKPEASTRGTLVHQVLFQFNKLYPAQLPDESRPDFYQIAEKVFQPHLQRGQTWAFWWLHFKPVLEWIWQQEKNGRLSIRQSFHEVSGELPLTVAQRSLIVQARADRVDWLRNDQLRLIDYKTGKSPSREAILSGQECQLPIELLIAEAGLFKNIPAKSVQELVIYNFGTEFKTKPLINIPTSEKPISQNVRQLLQETLDLYYGENPAPYEFVQQKSKTQDDYKLLARFASWNSDITEVEDES